MKITIINVVPLNRGDECLLDTLYNYFKNNIPGSYISVLGKNTDLNNNSNNLNHITYGPDLNEFWHLRKRKLYSPKYILKLMVSSINKHFYLDRCSWLFSEEERNVYNLLLTSDLIISNPGSYFHDHYDNSSRLSVLEFLLHRKKKVAILLHSLGPFWNIKSKKRFLNVFNNVAHLSVREEISKSLLIENGIDPSKVKLGSDLAFNFNVNKNVNRKNKRYIGLGFRSWSTLKEEEIITKAINLIETLLNIYDYPLYLISSVQGVEGYIDDSVINKKIFSRINKGLRGRVVLDIKPRSYKETIELFSCFDLYIGMRLHACIFNLLNLTPVYTLSLEHKVEGIYNSLGLNKMHNPFTLATEKHIASIVELMKNKDEIVESISNALLKARTLNNACLKCLHNI